LAIIPLQKILSTGFWSFTNDTINNPDIVERWRGRKKWEAPNNW